MWKDWLKNKYSDLLRKESLVPFHRRFWIFVYKFDWIIGLSVTLLRYFLSFLFNRICDFIEQKGWLKNKYSDLLRKEFLAPFREWFWIFVYNLDWIIGLSVTLLRYFLSFLFNRICDFIEFKIKLYYRFCHKKAEKFFSDLENLFEKISDKFYDLLDNRPFLLYMWGIILGAIIAFIIVLFENLDISDTVHELSENYRIYLKWLAYFLFTYYDLSLLIIFSLFIIVGFFLNPRYFSVPYLTPKVTALSISIIIFVLTILKIFCYDLNNTFESASKLFVGEALFYSYPSLYFVFDPISLSFGLLVSFIFPIIILTAWERIQFKPNFFYLNIIMLEIFSLGAFYTLDLFLFFIFFEAALVPMALIILLWGSRQRKVKATSYIFLYTLFGSAFFLTGVTYLYVIFGSTNYFFILNNLDKLSVKETYLLWFAFFIPFAIKIPMFPFHIWLPEAHVEAPTSGSIALAAILLKFGGYGFIRFLIPLFHEPSVFFSPLVNGLAIVGVIYSSLSATRHTDIKKIIAYSSIAHMNMVVLGIFSFNINALYGAVTLMLGHGLTSAALFFLAGVLYDRYHTRTLMYYGGMSQVMPLFSCFLFFFCAANLGFPCSVSFLGEFLVFIGVFKEMGLVITLLIGLSTVFGVYLNMLLFIGVCFGPLSNNINNSYQDLTARELKILIALFATSFLFLVFNSTYFSLLTHSSSIYFHLFV